MGRVMNPIHVNIYYVIDGEQKVVYNTYLAQGAVWMQSIIKAGGEITRIINSEKDS